MAKLMSKSELIQKIVAQHSNKMARKDVKAVIESLNKPYTKEPMIFKAKPARKVVRARLVKAVKAAVM